MTGPERPVDDLDPADVDPGRGADPVPSPAPSPLSPAAHDRAQAVTAGRWGIVAGACEQVGSIAVTIVLTRLLDPGEFGLVAAATIVLNLLYVFGNLGFGASIIKRRSIDEPVASTVFWASTGTGVVLTLALLVSAPLLTRALSLPEATPYVRGLAPLLLITMVSSVSEGRLLRELRFRWVYAADVTNIVVYAGTTVALAASGVGAWSMVIGRLAGELVATVVRLVAARWLPHRTFRWSAIRSDLRFTGGWYVVQFSSYLTKNIDYWVVSHVLGAAALGVYYIAFVLPTVLRQRLTWLSTEIMLPLMARSRDEPAHLAALVRESLELLCFLAVPVLIGIALTADQIVALAFGPDWEGAVVPLRWLAVAATFEVGTSVATTFFLAVDRAGTPSRMMLWRLGLMAAGLAVVASAGGDLEAVAATVAITTIASSGILLRALHRAIGVSAATVLRWLSPILWATAAMIAAVSVGGRLVASAPVGAQAAALAAIGAATYLGALALVGPAFARTVLRRSMRLAGRRPTGPGPA